MQLHWHRRNLQPHPNLALSTAFAAAKRNRSCVVSLFVLDDTILTHADRLGVAFMLGSLHTLRDWYRAHGGDLLIRRGDSTEIVSETAQTIGAERVVWNSDHSQLARGRDRAVTRALSRADITYTAVQNVQSTAVQSSTMPVSEPDAHLADPNTLELENRAVPQLTDLEEVAFDSAPLIAGTESAEKQLQAMSNGTTYRRCDTVDTRLSTEAYPTTVTLSEDTTAVLSGFR